MRATQLLGIGALTLGLFVPRAVAAQHVRAGLRGGRGHIAGRVTVGDGFRQPGYGRTVYRRPVRIVRGYSYHGYPGGYRYGYGYRPAPRVVFIQPFPVLYARPWGWWASRGFVQVTVWEDDAGNYYDYDPGQPNLREVTVYERDGHYYQPVDTDQGADSVAQ